MMPTVLGRVIDINTRLGVGGAFVDLDGYTAWTNTRGEFALRVPAGSYVLRVTHRDYTPYKVRLLVDRDIVLEDIPLVPVVPIL